jgi:transposase
MEVPMPRDDSVDDKTAALRERRSLNRRPEKVTDPAFLQDEFFDPRDLVQVKYEMLRRALKEGQTVTKACADFGFSRPSYYEAQRSFLRHGLAGLVPSKTGPRGAHKLTGEVLDFVQEALQEERVRPEVLVARIEDRFGVKVHPRSIERALQRRKKNVE